jgi:hypothetical protein
MATPTHTLMVPSSKSMQSPTLPLPEQIRDLRVQLAGCVDGAVVAVQDAAGRPAKDRESADVRRERWKAEYKRSQAAGEIRINSHEYVRICQGAEDKRCGNGRCVRCGVPAGHLHLLGCEMEQCPRCGGGITSCTCTFEKRPAGPLP